jgi:catechol 2,3-dioxygenase-like lactoylglutathione lyase family enzyme
MTGGTRTGIADLYTVGVPVTDQDRALDFYAGKLGLEKRTDSQFANGLRWIEVAPAGAATTIAPVPAKQDAPAGVETGIRFRTHDADAGNTELRSRSANVGDVLRWPGAPPMFVRARWRPEREAPGIHGDRPGLSGLSNCDAVERSPPCLNCES